MGEGGRKGGERWEGKTEERRGKERGRGQVGRENGGEPGKLQLSRQETYRRHSSTCVPNLINNVLGPVVN